MSNWSSRIRAERERQNLTREQVVQRMLQFLPDSEKAVTTRTLMAWEAGEREPRVTVGLALALALGVEDMTDLYLDSEPKLNRTGQQRLGEYRSMLLHPSKDITAVACGQAFNTSAALPEVIPLPSLPRPSR